MFHNAFLVWFLCFLWVKELNWKDLMLRGWLVRIILFVWLVSSAFIAYFLRRVDWIVHTQLYSFGLKFSLDWAQNYWSFFSAIYVFLAVPVVLSAIYLGLDILSLVKSRKAHVEGKPAQAAKPVRAAEPVETTKPVETNHMLISCPHCKRVFSRPLVMLDFAGGKTRLVNVCPYCNHTLDLERGEAENRESNAVEFAGKGRKETLRK
jgi:uncharacterized Zn-finger protein